MGKWEYWYRCLIIDTMPKTESPVEGKVFQSFMENLGWVGIRNKKRPDLVNKPLKKDFLRKLFATYKYEIIHLTLHGRKRRIYVGKKQSAITLREIDEYCGDFKLDKVELIMSTACYTGNDAWWELFQNLGCKFYIAPQEDPSIYEGIIFPMLVYMELCETGNVRKAYRDASTFVRTKGTEGKFKLFSKK